MSEYELKSDAHVGVTPAGAYYACASRAPSLARNLLFALMTQEITPTLTLEKTCEWSGASSNDEASELLYRMQSVGWIRGMRAARTAPAAHMEKDMPGLLKDLSAEGRALLADAQGFFLAANGFNHETSEALGALAADVGVVVSRHDGLVRGNLGVDSAAWSVVDAGGHSRIGFWPLYIGKHHFLLVISGEPHFHRSAFLNLVWSMSRRYVGDGSHSRRSVAGTGPGSFKTT
jgi:hypothetical protein